MKKSQHSKQVLSTPVTLGVLLDYTEEILMPAMSKLIDDKLDEKLKSSNAKLENNLKTYIDRRLTDNNIELLQKLDEKYFKDIAFKQKTVELFKKHKICTSADVSFLVGSIAAV